MTKLNTRTSRAEGMRLTGYLRFMVSYAPARFRSLNGNFIRDFQGGGFHSRMFELACFAYLGTPELRETSAKLSAVFPCVQQFRTAFI